MALELISNYVYLTNYSFVRSVSVFGISGVFRTVGFVAVIIFAVLIVIGIISTLAERPSNSTPEKRVREWEQLCPLSMESVITMLFWSFDHTANCTAPEYIYGSKDQPEPCVESLMSEGEDILGEFDCKYCKGQAIKRYNKNITIRMASEICYKFVEQAVMLCERDYAGKAMQMCFFWFTVSVSITTDDDKATKWSSWLVEYIDRRQSEAIVWG